MLFNNPISPAKINSLLAELWLTSKSEILDVGCGQGELMLRIVENFHCRVVGIEPDPHESNKARDKLKRYEYLTTLIEKPVEEVDLSGQSFDICFCIGSTYAYGANGFPMERALTGLQKLTKPGGLIIIGEGYWKKDPDPEYLSMSGVDIKELRSHPENVEIGSRHGLECIYIVTSSPDEWDHFESSFWMDAEKKLLKDPENEAYKKEVIRRRQWKNAYLKWGRDTMGFGLYVFLVPMETTT